MNETVRMYDCLYTYLIPLLLCSCGFLCQISFASLCISIECMLFLVCLAHHTLDYLDNSCEIYNSKMYTLHILYILLASDLHHYVYIKVFTCDSFIVIMNHMLLVNRVNYKVYVSPVCTGDCNKNVFNLPDFDISLSVPSVCAVGHL